MKLQLDTLISTLPRIGKALAKKFAKLGLITIKDLLFYFPYRYDDFSQVIPINKANPGCQVTIKAVINLIRNKKAFRKRMFITECLVSDKTDSLKIIWFNQPFITKILNPGDTAYFSGKIEHTKYGMQMASPIYEKGEKSQTHTARIVPVYSLTENLTTKQIRYLVRLALPLAKLLPEWIPQQVLEKYKLVKLNTAIKEIHFPSNQQTLAQAQYRLKFNELFLIQLKTEYIRRQIRQQKAPEIKFFEKETKNFVNNLPFQLTPDQKKTAWEIINDLKKDIPMNRLLEGDVGSGKTVVSAIGTLNVIYSGWQVAIMAPTEILAFQHYQTLTKIMPTNINIALLTRSKKELNSETASQKGVLESIKAGQTNLIIGTQAVIQKKVNFFKLGLVIVDEQHRFGVDQRKSLQVKNREQKQLPHFLSMTATPIPRSLALALYGDLDLSIIKELPKNRKKIITKIVPSVKREDAYKFIRKEIEDGRQAFVVCPLIDESDKLGVKSATAEYQKMKKEIFPDLKIGLLHGKLKAKEKEEVMAKFKDNKTNIIVSTTVVEVGVDVPNASIMIIEGAERFGLAQIHQLRGRVGRANYQSYCFIFTGSRSEKSLNRLRAIIETNNGFELAEKDLEMRGPGEIYGLKQSGFPDLKIAKLTDHIIIQQSKEAAKLLFEYDPALETWPILKRHLDNFSKNTHLE